MADQLCTPEDLASFLELTLDAYKAVMLVECATAVVQEAAAGQRIVQVVDDPGEQMGTTGSWLELPQRPVSALSHVSIDGGTELVAGTDFKRFGSRLWRACGWAARWAEPSTITYTYTHGHAAGAQGLQFARSAALGLLRSVYGNPTKAVRVAIDDYSASYEALSAEMEASPALAKALHRKYGSRAGLVRVS